MLKEFLFDVKLFAAIRVKAATKEDALRMISDAMECADSNFGAWPDGDPILGEACIDGTPDLLEIDGEDATC